MTTQYYRGYLIEVTSACYNGACVYRTTIVRSRTGELTHREASSVQTSFGSRMVAEDCAFQNARAWAELHPTYFRFAE
jgi:hypothetical protein